VVNLGQCYRKLGDLDKAREMYRKFLGEARPDDPARPGVERVIDEIEKEIAARPPKAAPPPREDKPAAVAAQTEPAVHAQTETKSGFRRFWWIIPVAAVVLAGAAVGLYFAFRSPGVDCSSVSLGCIDSTK
jgi:hypothetical protein